MEDSSVNINQNPSYLSKPDIIQMGKDMNFTSIFIIIYGAISCISIIGAIFGIPIIIAALRLKEAAEAFKHYAINNDMNALNYGFDKQANAFRILKILIIVSLIFYALAIILVFAILIPLLTQLTHVNGF